MNAREEPVLVTLALSLMALVSVVGVFRALGNGPRPVQARSGETTVGTVTETLMAPYDSTNGADWVRSDGWGESTPYCEWWGVTCGEGEVLELGLGNNNLSGTLPTELGGLGTLQALDNPGTT
jgi:hypothetical protein